MGKSKAQKRMERKFRDKVNVHVVMHSPTGVKNGFVSDATPDKMYDLGLALGLKDEGPTSRKLSNGKMTLNVVSWGQTPSWDEWYVTDIKKNGKTLIIVDEAYSCSGKFINLEKTNVTLRSLPPAPPVNGGWRWVS